MSEEEKKQQDAEQEEGSVHQGIPDARGKRKSPWSWVGSLYFAEGIPYILAMTVSVIMYKRMGVNNTDIAYYTSLLYLPWVIKPFWSPLVDILKTKRWWVVLMQFILGLGLLGVAFVLPMSGFFFISLVFLWLIAFSSATHDIACDGFYMLGLSKHQQAWFVGVRSSFYRLAMLTGQGILVIFAGYLESHTGLERVDITAAAVVESRPSMEHVLVFTGMDEADKAALKEIKERSYMDALEFYKEKAAAASSLEASATLAFEAEGLVNEIRSANPNDERIPGAITVLNAIKAPLKSRYESKANEMTAEAVAFEGNLRVVNSVEKLEIPIQMIPRADSNVTLYGVRVWNEVQGHAEGFGKIKAKEQPGAIGKAFSKYVSTPLGKFLENRFGIKKGTPPQVLGNIGVVTFRLSKAPEKGRSVTVVFGRKSGDKSIFLKEGTRFVFTEQNWNRPVKAAIQLDEKIREATETHFMATAGNIPLSWSLTFGLMAVMFFVFSLYHFFTLPHPVSDTSRYEESVKTGKPFTMGDFIKEFLTTFFSFFRKKGILPMLLFLCFYRFAEAQLVKMSSLFLLGPQEEGGLALTTGQVGFAYGTVGLICLSVGGILGGIVAARDGLKKWLLLMCVAINIPDIVYVYMAYAKPDNFATICACVGIETLGYGFGFTAYMLYMIFIADGEHKTAHFAIATGFMALGMMIPGMFSGWVQSKIGYQHFFVWVMIATIPSFLTLYIIPLDADFGKKKDKKAA
ncbi:MAG TPA: MFS transporter [Candidatus Sumerlaeota bacterium]|nr:MFS transporter [Candidatus Sumerlaeota bacterium]